MLRSVVVAAGLVLGVAPPVSALTFLEPETEETAAIDLVIAEATAGFSLYASDGAIHRFDGAGKIIASDVISRPTTSGSSIVNWPGRLRGHSIASGHHLMVIDDTLNKYPEAATGPIDYSQICTIDRFDENRILTRIWLSASPHAIRTTTTVDAEGGMWVLFHGGKLVRFAADCQATELGPVAGEIERMEADRRSQAVYLLAGDHRLIRVALGGSSWTVPLPQAGSWQEPWVEMIALESGGVVIDYTHSIDGSTLIAFNSTGSERWRRAGHWGRRGMTALDSGFLLTTVDDAIIHDNQGNEKLRFTSPEGHLVWRHLPTASPRTAWVMFNSSNPDNKQLVGLDIANGTARTWELEWDFVPMAALADQNMVLVRGANHPHWGDPGQSVHVTSGSALRELAMPPAGLGDRILAFASDSQGAVALIEHDQGWSLNATGAELAPKWSEWQATEEEIHHLRFQLALGDHQVCALANKYSRLQGESMAWIQCHDRHTGQATFAQAGFHALGPLIRPNIEQHPEIIFFDEQDGAMRRVQVDAGGNLLDTQTRPIPLAMDESFQISQVIYLDDDSLILRAPSETESITFVPADPGEPVQGFGFWSGWRGSVDPGTMVFAHDQLAVLGQRTDGAHDELALFSRYGDYLGLIEVPADYGNLPHRRLVSATPTGWQVAYLTEAYLFVRHYSVDGDEVEAPVSMRINLPERGENDLAERTILSSAGDQLVVVLPKATASRVHWVDPVNGVITASASARLLPSPGQPLAFGPQDKVVVAGEAPGNGARRAALWSGSTLTRQPVEQQAPASFDGAWFDPAVSGQGFFLDYVETANVLFGAWFTYGPDGGYRHEGLRWYTFAGYPNGSDQAVDADLYLNRNGQFDQGPITSAAPVGRVRIWQTDGDTLQFTVQFDGQAEDGFFLGHELERVLPLSDLTGVRHWFDPAISGQGVLLADPVEVDGTLFGGWFTYDVSGQADDEHAQHWFVLVGEPGATNGPGNRVTQIYRATGGRLGIRGTSSIDAIGTATLKQLTCDRLEMSYQFDNSEIAGSFAGKQGQRTLHAAAACP